MFMSNARCNNKPNSQSMFNPRFKVNLFWRSMLEFEMIQSQQTNLLPGQRACTIMNQILTDHNLKNLKVTLPKANYGWAELASRVFPIIGWKEGFINRYVVAIFLLKSPTTFLHNMSRMAQISKIKKHDSASKTLNRLVKDKCN